MKNELDKTKHTIICFCAMYTGVQHDYHIYQMMLVYSNTTGVTSKQELLTLPETMSSSPALRDVLNL
jgi:hypothetical protein